MKDEKDKIETLQWLDGALKWYNWNNLELRKRKINQRDQEFIRHEKTPKEGIDHLDETRIGITLCLTFTNLIDDKQWIWHTTYSPRKD